MNGDVVFYTGNWYAACRLTAVSTFKFIDPNGMAQPTIRKAWPFVAIRSSTTSRRSTCSCGCCSMGRQRETTFNDWLSLRPPM